MSTDPEIQFGDLEHDQPDVARRPDRNAHYAVVPYGEPDPAQLPIFVDLDVLIDMESHALTDTSIELGGVMLGGQLNDEEGKPYVVVLDSVRAEHYQATKGSFTFTHDTWEQITRRREEFPEDWNMVGWYHTHPDWGVFLSGMDMFICDNFFNKPLDVAFVIDPCRQERSFFQWTGDPRQRKRPVSAFYVIASRHRQAEVEQFVRELEGGTKMRTDPNLRAGYNVSGGGGGGPTIVNITEHRPGWLGQAVVGLCAGQFMLMLLILFMVVSPRMPGAEDDEVKERQSLAELKRELTLRGEVLDEVVQEIAGDRDVVSKLTKEREANAQLDAELASVLAGVPKIRREHQTLLDERNNFESKYEKAKTRAEKAEDELLALKDSLDKTDGTTTMSDLTDDTSTASADKHWYDWFTTPLGITVTVVLVIGLSLAGIVAMRGQQLDQRYPEPDDFPEPKKTEPPLRELKIQGESQADEPPQA